MADDKQPALTNPLQTNNTIIISAGYAAGILASKFPMFDSASWNSIVLAVLGLGVTVYTAYVNRKTAVITTTANLPEVKKEGGVILDKNVPGAVALAQSNATPTNVVAR